MFENFAIFWGSVNKQQIKKVVRDQRSQTLFMAIHAIPKSIQKTWDEWDLRGAVLVSLLLQILLILLAASRKRNGKFSLVIIVWLAYLMADSIAVFAIGLITNNQSSDQFDKVSVNSNVAAFWAPFLLLHLGGPDSITAFSIEDNELWIRHLFGLTVALVLVVYVLLLAIPNPFWIPSILVFLVGAVKYVERTVALYQACLDNFMNSLLPEQSGEIITLDWKNSLSNDPEEVQVLKRGHKFYKFFRGMVADSTFGFMVVVGSKEFFCELSAHDAFEIMEVELNFLYDELFTKMGMLHRGRFHYLYRFGCSALLWTAFLLFAFHKKANIHTIDIVITYALLVGAIVLDSIGLIKVIFSDWTVATTDTFTGVSKFMNAIRKRISFDSRWSGSIYQFNLISYASKKRFHWLDYVIDKLGLKSTFEEFLYKNHSPLSEGLKQKIFEGLKRSATRDSTKRIMGSQRGGATIDYYKAKHQCRDLGIVKWSVSRVEYDHSILLWHLATDLLYHTVKFEDQDGSHSNNLDNEAAKLCKILSDYMLYLLVMSPTLMMPSASSAGFETKIDKTCKEVRNILKGTEKSNEKKKIGNIMKRMRSEQEHEETESDDWKTFEKKSLLYQSYRLAKKLESVEEMWEMMGNVWLELLSYTARRCRGSGHAQHLAQGGELITFVSLLMHHFGMTETFQSLSEDLDLLL